MLISKRRIIHALSYEIILLVIIAVALSFIFHMPLEVTGVLGIAMAVTSVIWNMVFNHFFEKFEAKRKLKRTIGVIAVPQFFTRGSSFELPLVLWVFYRVKIKLLKFFFQTNSLELF